MNDKSIIETILLACPNSITPKIIRKMLESEISDDEIKSYINSLNDEYKRLNKGIYIDNIDNGYQIRTLKEYHRYIHFINNNNQKYKFSTAAIEVLSIIAFKQPVSKVEIESIRGVDSSGVIKKLLDNKLVKIQRFQKTQKRLIHYITTSNFLDLFGLNNLNELKNINEIKELLK
tara:strand:- start:2270 stop:2794 length:525 start_codon:yes stop_codon:yes gene_type:complete